MNRRGFLGLLAAAPAAVVLAPDLVELLAPKRTIFLPPRGGWHVDMSHYLTTNEAWFLKSDPSVTALCVNGHPWCNRCIAPLTEKGLEEMLDYVVKTRQRISIKPTRLIVHPSWTREQVEERIRQL